MRLHGVNQLLEKSCLMINFCYQEIFHNLLTSLHSTGLKNNSSSLGVILRSDCNDIPWGSVTFILLSKFVLTNTKKLICMLILRWYCCTFVVILVLYYYFHSNFILTYCIHRTPVHLTDQCVGNLLFWGRLSKYWSFILFDLGKLLSREMVWVVILLFYYKF